MRRLLPLLAAFLLPVLARAGDPEGTALPSRKPKPGRYEEPAHGPRMIVDNQRGKRRLLGADRYCVREILVDQARVFGGLRCRVSHGAQHALRLAPGKHKIIIDAAAEFDSDPELPPERMFVDVEAGDKDFLLVLKDAQEPKVVPVGDDAAQLLPGNPPAEPAAETPAPGAAAPVAAAQPAAGPAPDPFEKLEKLKLLYDKGVITKKEFEETKKELLKAIPR